tara:strand:+ start:1754 stop:2098 length:345 start_codon:yes stop_codon:yes gene_type:complete
MSVTLQEATTTGLVRTREVTGKLIYHKVVTVVAAGARVRVPVGPAVLEITVQAAASNGGLIFIGDSEVTNAAGAKVGLSLSAGATFGPIRIEQPGQLWVDAAGAGYKLVVFGVA